MLNTLLPIIAYMIPHYYNVLVLEVTIYTRYKMPKNISKDFAFCCVDRLSKLNVLGETKDSFLPLFDSTTC